MLGFSDGAEQHIENLKMRLINRDFSLETKVLCATFLALVLRYVRGWLLDEHRNTYRDRQLIWLVNIGLPTDSYHDDELVSIYKEIVTVAWTVSVLPGHISLEQVHNLIEKIDTMLPLLLKAGERRLLDDQYIHAFPEFAVQLVGYIRSTRRQENLHALADVGAGTFDFTTFNVFRKSDGEDRFPIFARGVQPLGTQFFVQHRLKNMQTDSVWNPSPYEDVPHDSVFEDQLSLSELELHDLDKQFSKLVKSLISDKLLYTKKNRIPNSEHWDSGVPTFLCGGGATVDFYREIFRSFEAAKPPYKIRLRSLNLPEDLRANSIPKGTYNRLSVAYGLSYDPYDIGKIIRMEDIEDIKPEQVSTESYRDRYIDKDMV